VCYLLSSDCCHVWRFVVVAQIALVFLSSKIRICKKCFEESQETLQQHKHASFLSASTSGPSANENQQDTTDDNNQNIDFEVRPEKLQTTTMEELEENATLLDEPKASEAFAKGTHIQ
jgi:hypothetical protein